MSKIIELESLKGRHWIYCCELWMREPVQLEEYTSYLDDYRRLTYATDKKEAQAMVHMFEAGQLFFRKIRLPIRGLIVLALYLTDAQRTKLAKSVQS